MGSADQDFMLVMIGVSLVAGFATTLGALFVLLLGALRRRTLSVLLGFATGVMVTVVILDLLPSAWRWGGARATFTGLAMGIVIIAIADVVLSQWTLTTQRGQRAGPLRKMGYLIALGISLHDFPEGIAIAAGSATESHIGWIIGIAIGLHNIPEGIATAAPLRMSGLAAWKVLALTVGMAFFTPLGTILGFGLLSMSIKVLAQLLALAGGAMIYLVWDELWPEAKKNHPYWAYLGALSGAVGMALISFYHH